MKIIATDFDGTLNYNGKVSDSDREAIELFRCHGNKFGIVTGRDLEASLWFFYNYKLKCDFVISCTGAIITDGDGKIIYSKKAKTGEFLCDIINKAISLGAGLFVVSDGLRRYHIDVHGKIPYDLSLFPEFNHCNTWFESDESATEFVKYVKEKYPEKISAYRNGNSVDMPPPSVSKTSGIYEYASNFEGAKIYTAGDNYNDIPMLKEFCGFAVSNALDKVKEEAGHTCDRICDMIEYIMKEDK